MKKKRKPLYLGKKYFKRFRNIDLFTPNRNERDYKFWVESLANQKPDYRYANTHKKNESKLYWHLNFKNKPVPFELPKLRDVKKFERIMKREYKLK